MQQANELKVGQRVRFVSDTAKGTTRFAIITKVKDSGYGAVIIREGNEETIHLPYFRIKSLSPYGNQPEDEEEQVGHDYQSLDTITKNNMRRKTVAECLTAIYNGDVIDTAINDMSVEKLRDFVLETFNKGLFNSYLSL